MKLNCLIVTLAVGVIFSSCIYDAKNIKELGVPFDNQDSIFTYLIDSTHFHLFLSEHSEFKKWDMELSIEEDHELQFHHISPYEPISFIDGVHSFKLGKNLQSKEINIALWAKPNGYFPIDSTTNLVNLKVHPVRYFTISPGILKGNIKEKNSQQDIFLLNDSIYLDAVSKGYLRVRN